MCVCFYLSIRTGVEAISVSCLSSSSPISHFWASSTESAGEWAKHTDDGAIQTFVNVGWWTVDLLANQQFWSYLMNMLCLISLTCTPVRIMVRNENQNLSSLFACISVCISRRQKYGADRPEQIVLACNLKWNRKWLLCMEASELLCMFLNFYILRQVTHSDKDLTSQTEGVENKLWAVEDCKAGILIMFVLAVFKTLKVLGVPPCTNLSDLKQVHWNKAQIYIYSILALLL